MTKEEIKAAIAKGIAGQGTNVDGGGYLPKILDAIVDAIPDAPQPQPAIVIEGAQNADDNTFTPNDPTYTYEVVKGLILAGRAVFVKYFSEMPGINICDAAISITDNGISFGESGIALPA